ncbi:MAG TPA: PRC-barrel domain-containing protein [Gemmatimonadaceae bacterium]|nr:PRC-barrel domain-containing protein [Gemmatimonadaceae bacterium]
MMATDRTHEHHHAGEGIDPRAGVLALESLNALDGYELADGEPDIRGWRLRATDGAEVGTVHDLLVDTGAMKVRYLDVELDDRRDRHVLVPIELAQLQDDAEVVRVPDRSAAELSRLPTYDHGVLTREREQELLGYFGR